MDEPNEEAKLICYQTIRRNLSFHTVEQTIYLPPFARFLELGVENDLPYVSALVEKTDLYQDEHPHTLVLVPESFEFVRGTPIGPYIGSCMRYHAHLGLKYYLFQTSGP